MAVRGRRSHGNNRAWLPADRRTARTEEGHGGILGGPGDRRWAGGDCRHAAPADLRDAGLSGIPSNTFSLYDHVLDTAVMVDAVPDRFAALNGLDAYFAMARGAEGVAPLEMTKWFDTNYHYLVPELGPCTDLRLASVKPVREYLQARSQGIETRPVVLGPVSFLLLS